jgi:hypothetical protein
MSVSSGPLVESVVQLLSPTPPPQIKRPIKCRTFRISSIPPDVAEGELRAYLKDLLEDGTPDDFIISLVPYSYGKEQMATVSFTRKEPKQFSECKADERLYLRNEGMKSRIIVDCNFQGSPISWPICLPPVLPARAQVPVPLGRHSWELQPAF